MSQTLLEPDINLENQGSGRWMVVIFNNDTNSMDEVIDILIKATHCDIEEAMIEMWEAHTFGKAPVHFSSRSTCEEIALVIRTVGIKTEVCPEWDD